MEFVISSIHSKKEINEKYDVVVLGGGIAGISASIYLKRYAINSLLISSEIGGLIKDAHRIENYPGFSSITGQELSSNFEKQLNYLGVEKLIDDVVEINFNENEEYKIELKTKNNKTIKSKYLIYALGSKRKRLSIPNEEKYYGKGLSYCFTCDGAFFKDKIVSVIGGGDAALTGALYLSDIAKKVFLIHRRKEFRAEDMWIKKAKEKSNIEFILEDEVKEIVGNDSVEKINLKSGKKVELNGIFIEIGNIPNTLLLKNTNVEFDDKGFVIVDSSQKTSNEYIYAAGDLTNASQHFEQLVTSASEGAICVHSIQKQLNKN
ncbi:MAG: FAD-dependent oxidoreductase [Candidatus Nanoarchaeia archaeon]|nr:FAD-dependent oxidoreductase [Candidatus Nanoarchaeia archaeon]